MSTEDDGYRSGLSTEDYHRLTGFAGDWRDTWWDDDFLAMMGRRWRLHEVSSVLDVGCGIGHWGQRLMRHLSADTQLVGVDAEESWVVDARERSVKLGLAERSRYEVARAESLPFADESFDMVTCQTLLMHVADPQVVVTEMVRVLRPGGVFVAAEPNNFGTTAGLLMGEPTLSWTDISDLLELAHTCARGKEALGEGWYSAGERVPSYLTALGWDAVHTDQNNCCATRIPPYEELGARTSIDMMRTAVNSGAVMTLGGTPENVRRYFIAGGGDPERLPQLIERQRKRDAENLKALDEGKLVSAGGHIHHLVWGHKPG
jgi:SAM-dependent methyltransferase